MKKITKTLKIIQLLYRHFYMKFQNLILKKSYRVSQQDSSQQNIIIKYMAITNTSFMFMSNNEMLHMFKCV